MSPVKLHDCWWKLLSWGGGTAQTLESSGCWKKDCHFVAGRQPSDDEPASAVLNSLIVEWGDEDKTIARRVYGKAVFSEPHWMALDRWLQAVILQ